VGGLGDEESTDPAGFCLGSDGADLGRVSVEGDVEDRLGHEPSIGASLTASGAKLTSLPG
jgi:hypothetical protein